MPAKAGIQGSQAETQWIPAFAGMTDFYFVIPAQAGTQAQAGLTNEVIP